MALCCAVLAVFSAVMAIFDVSVSLRIVLVATTLLAGYFGQAFFGQWLAERRETATRPVEEVVSQDALEQGRQTLLREVEKERVREGSQLDRMVPRGPVMGVGTREHVAPNEGDQTSPRVRIRGQTRPWSHIKREWDRSAGRMVILGAPGFGKTVAALTLLKHINARPPDEPHKSAASRDSTSRGVNRKSRSKPSPALAPGAVAEVFPLVEWYRWHTQRSDGLLGDWLADQLTTTYPAIERQVTRALVDNNLVMPLLDGLDEVPAAFRLTCKERIDAYAERDEPFRPFVVTCRTTEYEELYPNWVDADREIELVGLQPDQIRLELKRRTAGRPGWGAVRERIADGDAVLLELFGSPLRLAIALQAFHDREPSELVAGDLAAAQRRLWDLLLDLGTPTFHDAGRERIKRWLSFLAVGMKKQGRQRLWVHELYLFAPRRFVEQRRFEFRVRLLAGLVIGVTAAGSGALAIGLEFGLNVAVLLGLLFALAPVLYRAQVSVSAIVPWRARLQAAKDSDIPLSVGMKVGLGGAMGGGVVMALIVTPDAGAVLGIGAALIVALLFGVGGGVLGVLQMGNILLAADPPPLLAGRPPDAVLTATRNNGRSIGLAAGVSVGIAAGTAVGIVAGPSRGVASGLTTAVCIGLFLGLHEGLFAWYYHHWLHRRLVRHDLLPARLTEFLAWCAEPARGWLRPADAYAYEFRHRELLNHLAPDASEPDHPANTQTARLAEYFDVSLADVEPDHRADMQAAGPTATQDTIAQRPAAPVAAAEDPALARASGPYGPTVERRAGVDPPASPPPAEEEWTPRTWKYFEHRLVNDLRQRGPRSVDELETDPPKILSLPMNRQELVAALNAARRRGFVEPLDQPRRRRGKAATERWRVTEAGERATRLALPWLAVWFRGGLTVAVGIYIPGVATRWMNGDPPDVISVVVVVAATLIGPALLLHARVTGLSGRRVVAQDWHRYAREHPDWQTIALRRFPWGWPVLLVVTLVAASLVPSLEPKDSHPLQAGVVTLLVLTTAGMMIRWVVNWLELESNHSEPPPAPARPDH